MATLTRSDLAQAEHFLRRLYRCRRQEALARYVLTELPALVGADQASWNEVVPALSQADVMAWPPTTEHERFQSALARHIRSHPLIAHFLSTGDPTAWKISDLVSKPAFHNSALYDELYRHLKYEDQFAMNLARPSPRWTSVVVARDRRTFTERDRQLLNLLRPHLAQAQRQARAIARLSRKIESGRAQPATSRIALDERGRIVRYPSRAQRWIEQYIGRLPNAPRQLPDELQRWLVEIRIARNRATPEGSTSPYVVDRCGRQLIVRLVADGPDGAELILEERSNPKATELLAGTPLSPRERQVLLEVEKGKRNNEIAVTLGIRPATVKKHLEHIFDKLAVDSRTAAVVRLRQLRDALET